jgi:hypothetical protein
VWIDASMTIDAVRGCPLEDTIDVATGTGDTDVFPGQFECKQVMVDGSRPTRHLMAKGTIRAILPFVLIVFLMTGIAVGWYSHEDIVDMATLTGYADMLALQCESGQIVVEGCREPGVGCMAVPTVGAKPAGVRIDLPMTSNAVYWRPFEDGIDVATGAGSRNVFPGQFECKLVMVDDCRPPFDIMAIGAVRAILSFVLIVFLVAGIAIGWRILENIVDMTTLTGYADMFAS